MAVEFPLLKEHWGFPGGPMVKTLLYTRGHGCDPWSGKFHVP